MPFHSPVLLSQSSDFLILYLIYSTHSTQVAGACLPPHTVFCRFFPDFFLTAIILSPANDD